MKKKIKVLKMCRMLSPGRGQELHEKAIRTRINLQKFTFRYRWTEVCRNDSLIIYFVITFYQLINHNSLITELQTGCSFFNLATQNQQNQKYFLSHWCDSLKENRTKKV